MLERIAITLILIGLGVLAYRLLLSAQHHAATLTAGRERVPGRSALLVFTSPTCAPCKLQQLPIVDRLMTGWADRVDVRVIDVTEQPDTAARFGVWSLPTTIVLDGAGQVEAINQGVASERKLRAQFERISGWATKQQLTTDKRISESAN
ncbi:MAG TPA: thioredoxin family protein [Anaerolineae bacterium]|nr:thioredoxin family protein [Anaerolineae bacterium]